MNPILASACFLSVPDRRNFWHEIPSRKLSPSAAVTRGGIIKLTNPFATRAPDNFFSLSRVKVWGSRRSKIRGGSRDRERRIKRGFKVMIPGIKRPGMDYHRPAWYIYIFKSSSGRRGKNTILSDRDSWKEVRSCWEQIFEE